MPNISQSLLSEIQTLSDDEKQRVLDFIRERKRLVNADASLDNLMHLANASWAPDWNNDAEDEAWKNL